MNVEKYNRWYKEVLVMQRTNLVHRLLRLLIDADKREEVGRDIGGLSGFSNITIGLCINHPLN